MAHTPKRKRGRPPIENARRKTKNFTFRGSTALHEQLRLAANRSRRSVSDEIALRLTASFKEDEGLPIPISGDAELQGILTTAAVAMKQAGEQAAVLSAGDMDAAKTWHQNPHAFDQAVRAADRVFGSLRPEGEIKPLSIGLTLPNGLDLDQAFGNFGAGLANHLLRGVAETEPVTGSAVTWAPRLRSLLGPRLVELLRNRMTQG